MTAISPVVSAHGLTHTYRTAGKKIEALQNVSLSIAQGETCVVSGESGSGKTTLLLVLCGLLRPTLGTVRLFSESSLYDQSYGLRAKLRREQIGFMLPSFHLLPYLNAEDNIRVARNKASKSCDFGIGKLLDAAGLSARRRHRPGQLSTGEQRRLMLCRALVNNPQWLVCDEPIANLDPENVELVCQMIEEFANQRRAVLVVTHERAASFAPTSRYVMQAGTLSAV